MRERAKIITKKQNIEHCQRRCKNPQLWRFKNTPPIYIVILRVSSKLPKQSLLLHSRQTMLPTFLKYVTFTLNIDSRAMVQYPIQNCRSNNMVVEYISPFTIRLI